MAYYGIFIPNDKKSALSEEEAPFVFSNRDEAFKVLRKFRESRLKCFKTYGEAEFFANYGLETSTSNDVNATKNDSDTQSNNNSCDAAPKVPLVGEKPSSFRGPTSQELVKFRKLIEQGDIDSVHNTVWSNPRYFVSSGDTPTILKESFRYNALHVAAIAKNPGICSLILETVGDPKFIQLLHGKDDYRTAEDVANILLDLYLNMPEKGRSETPLHFAAKNGSIEVVEVLTSYKECQMNMNSEGLLPKDIICSRNETAGSDVVKAIKNLLEERFYVPVIRSIDNSLPPVIGEPFSPTQPIHPMSDLLSPEMEIRAVAGPMNKEQAETFRKRWKTPPRNQSSPASFLTSPRNQSPAAFLTSPRDDKSAINGSPLSSYPVPLVRQRNTPIKGVENDTPTKVLEKTARRLFDFTANGDSDNSKNGNDSSNLFKLPQLSELATPKKSLFNRYRDDLDDNLDDSINSSTCSSTAASPFDTPGFKERHLKLADVEKGLEVIGRGLAKDQNIGWREHWTFLNEFIDIGSTEGLVKLEKYLQDKLNEKMKPPTARTNSQRKEMDNLNSGTPVSKICRGINNLQFSRESLTIDVCNNPIRDTSTPTSPSAFHAHMCVEKSCQIYAKRLIVPIMQQPNNIVKINDALIGELSRLKSLVCSYKEDLRFFAIDFSAAHSRFGHIVIALLNDEETKQHNLLDVFQNCLKMILEAKEKVNMNGNKNYIGADEHSKNVAQLICLIKQLLKRLNDRTSLIAPQILTTERECADIWNNEEKCDCEWMNATVKVNRNIKRKMENSQRLSDSFSDFCAKLNGLNVNGGEATEQSEDDDDVFLSFSNSDDEDYDDDLFYTPPQSPTDLSFELNEPKVEYDNYIYGPEPTKMDNDVMNALHNIDIDKNAYPNIFKWHCALSQFTLEERSSFPPPMVNTKSIAVVTPSSRPSNPIQAKRFIRTPILPKSNKFHLKPSTLSK